MKLFRDVYDPPRVCDICGVPRRKSQLVKHADSIWVCSHHVNERVAQELDELIADQEPIRILPVPDAKPINRDLPNLYEAAEGHLLNFIAQQVTTFSRYENITHGDGSPIGGNLLSQLGWAGKYVYEMIAENTRPTRFLVLARNILYTVATRLREFQIGFGTTSSATKATAERYGAFVESENDFQAITTIDQAACGLAMLYAYRVFGSRTLLDSARASASFLRNVQAIGECGVNYTSSDSAGTARLNTGAVTSYTVNAPGLFSDHRFYPSGLLALEFWDALQDTDGDQSIGATAAISGAFTTAPAQLLSISIAELRAFWTNGIPDTGTPDAITGFSPTTPREMFNAFPAIKPATTITGTGQWEYQDAGASTGTLISAQNFAIALEALYAYESASSQVTAVDDWLRSFTSNSAFETPDNTAPKVLAETVTGDYDPKITLATLLQVRDASDSYAAIAQNGSSLYDWGAFGLLSTLWQARHRTSFLNSRIYAVSPNYRLDTGTPVDGDQIDWIELRGKSGLSFQTAFTESVSGADYIVNDGTLSAEFGRCFRLTVPAVVASGDFPIPEFLSTGTSSDAPVTSPDLTDVRLWVMADGVLARTGVDVTEWGDQSGNDFDYEDVGLHTQPDYSANQVGTLPLITFTGTWDSGDLLFRNNFLNTIISSGNDYHIFAAMRPPAGFGGGIWGLGLGEGTGPASGTTYFAGTSSIWIYNTGSATPPRVTWDNAVAFDGASMYLLEWRVSAGDPIPAMQFLVNGVLQTTTIVGNVKAPYGDAGTSFGALGAIGATAGNLPGLTGGLGEFLIYNTASTVARVTRNYTYLGNKWGISLP